MNAGCVQPSVCPLVGQMDVCVTWPASSLPHRGWCRHELDRTCGASSVPCPYAALWQGAWAHQLEFDSPSAASGLLRAARPCLRPSSSQLTTCSQGQVPHQLAQCLGALSQRRVDYSIARCVLNWRWCASPQLPLCFCTSCLPVCLLGPRQLPLLQEPGSSLMCMS